MVTVKNEESFRNVIFVNIVLLKFCGIIPPDDKTFFNMVFNYCLAIMAGGFMAANGFVYGFEFVRNFADIETAMDLLALTISFSGGLIRFLILYWSRQTVQKVLETVEDIWKILNPQERHYVTLYTDGVKNLTYFFLLECLFSIIFYSLATLSANQFDPISNATIRVLPYAFVTEVHQSPYYEIMYFIQICSVANSCTTAVAVEICGPLLITIICGHFKVIQEQLKSMNSIERTDVSRRGEEETQEISGREKRRSHDEKSLHSELGACVNYHTTILS